MLRKKLYAMGLSVCVLMSTVLMPMNVFAAEHEYSTKDFTTSFENEITPYWLAPGAHTQYPSQGGKWTYGFWDAKVRSYYTVNRCHGSSVKYNGGVFRSVDTIAGKKSIAEKWAVNLPGSKDEYYYRVCD